MTAPDGRGAADWDPDEHVAPAPTRPADARGGYRPGDDGPDVSDNPGPPAALASQQASIIAGLRRREQR